MRPIKTGTGSRWQRLEKPNRGESIVATVWLVLYVLLLGSAIASSFIPDAMQLATR